MNFESINQAEQVSVDDYDGELYLLLNKLPAELAKNHIRYFEAENMSDNEAIDYIQSVLEHRQEAVTVTEFSDKEFATAINNEKERFLEQVEGWAFNNPDNFLGQGTTAKVKSLTINTPAREFDLALKYVTNPQKGTLAAAKEHNIVKEVELLHRVDTAEKQHDRRTRFIRVPHPYFHHTNEKLQMYGMEKVDGINLQQAIDGYLHDDFKNTLAKSALATVPLEELDGYFERFFETMHEYCLHGDIKPRNIMVSSEGVFYIIDFGQSRLTSDVPTGAEEQFENLKADEVLLAKNLMKRFVTELRRKID